MASERAACIKSGRPTTLPFGATEALRHTEALSHTARKGFKNMLIQGNPCRNFPNETSLRNYATLELQDRAEKLPYYIDSTIARIKITAEPSANIQIYS